MQAFQIDFHPSVRKDLRSLPREITLRVIAKIGSLADDPFPPGHLKMQGLENTYRVRVGDYRIVYQVNTKIRLVYVEYVRHRKDAYD
jgi:mRNA interferase RelE/StbE